MVQSPELHRIACRSEELWDLATQQPSRTRIRRRHETVGRSRYSDEPFVVVTGLSCFYLMSAYSAFFGKGRRKAGKHV